MTSALLLPFKSVVGELGSVNDRFVRSVRTCWRGLLRGLKAMVSLKNIWTNDSKEKEMRWIVGGTPSLTTARTALFGIVDAT